MKQKHVTTNPTNVRRRMYAPFRNKLNRQNYSHVMQVVCVCLSRDLTYKGGPLQSVRSHIVIARAGGARWPPPGATDGLFARWRRLVRDGSRTLRETLTGLGPTRSASRGSRTQWMPTLCLLAPRSLDRGALVGSATAEGIGNCRPILGSLLEQSPYCEDAPARLPSSRRTALHRRVVISFCPKPPDSGCRPSARRWMARNRNSRTKKGGRPSVCFPDDVVQVLTCRGRPAPDGRAGPCEDFVQG